MNSKNLIGFIILCFGPLSSVYGMDVTGLNDPESVVKDPRTGNYYISNVNGAPLEKDHNGYITKIGPKDVVVVLKFIQGIEGEFELHAPKGLLIRKNTLFVSDVDTLKGFDLATGEAKYHIPMKPEPQFLNDITLGWDEALFVSDMTGNRIYRVDTKHDYEVSVFLEDEALGQPNGLLFNEHAGRLIAAGWKSGQIMEIDREGHITVIRDGLKHLDGVTADRQGNLYVSSFTEGEIYRIEDWGKGKLSLFETGLNAPADIFFDQEHKMLLVPLMKDNAMVSFDTA